MRILLLSLLPAACGGMPAPKADVPAQPPAVFAEPSSIGKVLTTRSYKDRDVVEALFAEALERDTALAALLAAIDEAQAQFNDSAQAFLSFRANNAAFHASAEAHVQALADSAERQAWNVRLRANRALMDEHAATTEDLLAARTALSGELLRLRTLLKLEHALAAMRHYQLEGMPSDAGMAGALSRLKTLQDRLRATLEGLERP